MMRTRIAALLGGCFACCGAQPAWAQLPPEAPPVTPPFSAPSAPPSPAPFPPPAPWPLAPSQPATFGAPPPPLGAPQIASTPQSPPAEKPIALAGRVGFGIGLWAAPLGLAGQSDVGAAGGLGALGGLGGTGANYGSALGIRWWVRERVLLIPALILGISHTTVPDQDGPYQGPVKGSSYTNGTVSPSLSLGYAAYRGTSSRFLLLGGVSFAYTVNETITVEQLADNSTLGHYEAMKSVSVAAPVGLAFEQFFTPRLSISLSTSAPLVSYRSSKTGNGEATTRIGADFAAAQLGAAVFFYTD